MLIHLRQVLNQDELRAARALLASAPWADGKTTAGEQSALVKNNQQLPQDCTATKELQRLVMAGLARHKMFFAAALPKTVFPPLFNRYGGRNNAFGNHIDNAVRYVPGGGARVRTDLSCTLFLSDPGEYEGGALVMASDWETAGIKLPAGDMFLYSSDTVHRVESVTRGWRLASFFWVESMVRGNDQRQLLFDMDKHLMQLRSEVGDEHPAVIGLTGSYHNLLRQWATV